MPHTASPIEGFRNPWTQGAKAYYEADTFAAAKEGFRRKRKPIIFHMPNPSEASVRPCVTCGVPLGDAYAHNPGQSSEFTASDKNSTWHYDPRTKEIFGGQHYYCSWLTLLTAVARLGH